jgi:hypothetical protein
VSSIRNSKLKQILTAHVQRSISFQFQLGTGSLGDSGGSRALLLILFCIRERRMTLILAELAISKLAAQLALVITLTTAPTASPPFRLN